MPNNTQQPKTIVDSMRIAVRNACEAPLPGTMSTDNEIMRLVLKRVYDELPQLRTDGSKHEFFSKQALEANDDLVHVRSLLHKEVRASLAFIYPGRFKQDSIQDEDMGSKPGIGSSYK